MAAHGVHEEEPNFIDFLYSLSYEDQYKRKPSICYNRTTDSEYSGVQRFIRELELQKNDHQRDTEQTRRDLKDKFQTELRQVRGFTGNFDEIFEFIKHSMFELQQLDKIKADVDYPSSTWKVEHFQKYVKTLDIRFMPPFQQVPAPCIDTIKYIPANDFMAIQYRYRELASVYLDTYLSCDEDVSFLKELQKLDFHEPTTRLFIDALITPILRGNSMRARLEEKLYNYKDGTPSLPNCIADYVIYSRDGKILGAIETKAGGYLKAESVIQCMLQLLALRRKAPHTLFGVVTDAVRYVFIVLTEDGTFTFERNGAAIGCYYDINSWEDLRTVAGILNDLLQHRQHEDRSVSVFCLPLPDVIDTLEICTVGIHLIQINSKCTLIKQSSVYIPEGLSTPCDSSPSPSP